MNFAKVVKETHDCFSKLSAEELRNAKITFSETPREMKITPAAKTLIRYLCKVKPWEKYPGEEYFGLEFDKKDIKVEYSDFECLFGIRYVQSIKIGRFGLSYDMQSPLSGAERRGDSIILKFRSDSCADIFTDDLPDTLDMFDAWDDICCRDDGEDD